MKSTKKSLLLSTLSLIMCVAMLLGTTYAWFTDSVTSGKNKIVAGNLDVELYYGKTLPIAQIDDNKVQGETDLFDVALWEPGVIAFENFTVANVGNLALKYALNLNVFDKNTYKGKDLTEVIKVAVVDNGFNPTGTTPEAKRAEAQTLSFGTLADFQKTGNLAAKNDGDTDESTYGIVLYWEPTDYDNDYNVNNYTGERPTSDGQPLFVEFGINLVATQDTVEADSFDNQYDKNATFKANATATAVAGKTTKFILPITPAVESGENTTVEFEEGALSAGEYKLEVTTENNLFELKSDDGKNAASIDLKLYDKDGTLTTAFADGKNAVITTYVTKELKNPTVKYNGTGDPPTLISYIKETGKLEFSTNHFSEYQLDTTSAAYIKETDLAYDTFEGALTAANATETPTTVVMLNDCSYAKNGTGLWNITNSVTLEGMGHSLNGYGNRSNNKTTLAINNGGSKSVNVTLKNLTINSSGAAGRPIETRGNIGTINLEKVTIKATGSGNTQGLTVGGSQTSKAVINIKDSAINAGSSGYPIVTFNPVKMDIQGSELHGYCALYLKGQLSSAGSRGSVITAKNCNFDAPNIHDSADGWNSFGCFVIEDDGINLTIDSCVINAVEKNTAGQHAFVMSSAAERFDNKVSVSVKGDSTEIGGICKVNNSEWDSKSAYSIEISGGNFTADPSDFVADGYQAVDNGNGVWTVKPAN